MALNRYWSFGWVSWQPTLPWGFPWEWLIRGESPGCPGEEWRRQDRIGGSRDRVSDKALWGEPLSVSCPPEIWKLGFHIHVPLITSWESQQTKVGSSSSRVALQQRDTSAGCCLGWAHDSHAITSHHRELWLCPLSPQVKRSRIPAWIFCLLQSSPLLVDSFSRCLLQRSGCWVGSILDPDYLVCWPQTPSWSLPLGLPGGRTAWLFGEGRNRSVETQKMLWTSDSLDSSERARLSQELPAPSFFTLGLMRHIWDVGSVWGALYPSTEFWAYKTHLAWFKPRIFYFLWRIENCSCV